jgi:outer membrane lipoprotein SlyB
MTHPHTPLRCLPFRPLAAGLLALTALLLSACASPPRPVVYEEPQRGKAAAPQVAQDLQACQQRAEARVGLNARRADTARRSVAQTGAIGFVSTAAASLVSGSRDVWQRARAGAAAGITGAAVKAAFEWNDPDGVYRAHVERCMEDRGHDVLGWR